MTDAVGVAYGTGNESGLPPVNLPSLGPAPRTPVRITVGPSQKPQAASDGGWGDMAPAFKPAETKAAPADDHPDGAWGATVPQFTAGETEQKPKPTISTTDATARSAVTGFTLGFEPALEGAAAASGLPKEADLVPGGSIARRVIGAGKIALGAKGAKDTYDKKRQEEQDLLDAGREQHPVASTIGELGGAALLPVPGGLAGSVGARIAKGVVTGGVGGAAYGTGKAVSEGKDLSGVLHGAEEGGVVGAALGGPLGAVLGRAGPGAVPTRGERAARTAEDLGAPLPKGLASDSPAIQATTAKLRSIPFAGERIGHRVEATAEAAGEHIGDIASHMAGGTPSRAVADAVVRPGLEHVVEGNRQAIDAAYNTLRGQLHGHHYTLPRLAAALNAVVAARRAAGWPNPEQGLEQFRNVANGATFNGAHRARVDAREAGNVLIPHPGYNAADYNRLTQAMTADLREIVRADAVRSPQQAVRAFLEAEQRFGELADQNGILHRLINSRGEGAIATLLGAAREKGGDVRLLAQLRNSMNPADFQQIGGTLLHELGWNAASGEFSLAHFVTNWNKVSDRAAHILFSPQHLRDIGDIVNLGTHVKSSLRSSNSSHTASVLVLLDLAKDVALLTADAMHGGVGIGTVVGAGSSAALWTLTHWLGNPAQAAAMSAWTRAYHGVAQSQTPARIAAFRVATRNLSNNLGVPVEKIAGLLQGPARAPADEQPSP